MMLYDFVQTHTSTTYPTPCNSNMTQQLVAKVIQPLINATLHMNQTCIQIAWAKHKLDVTKVLEVVHQCICAPSDSSVSWCVPSPWGPTNPKRWIEPLKFLSQSTTRCKTPSALWTSFATPCPTQNFWRSASSHQGLGGNNHHSHQQSIVLTNFSAIKWFRIQNKKLTAHAPAVKAATSFLESLLACQSPHVHAELTRLGNGSSVTYCWDKQTPWPVPKVPKRLTCAPALLPKIANLPCCQSCNLRGRHPKRKRIADCNGGSNT